MGKRTTIDKSRHSGLTSISPGHCTRQGKIAVGLDWVRGLGSWPPMGTLCLHALILIGMDLSTGLSTEWADTFNR